MFFFPLSFTSYPPAADKHSLLIHSGWEEGPAQLNLVSDPWHRYTSRGPLIAQKQLQQHRIQVQVCSTAYVVF